MKNIQINDQSSGFVSTFSKNWTTILHLALVVMVVYLFEIEGSAFLQIIILAAIGFSVSIFLPLSYRLIFFVLLSIVGIFWVFGPIDSIFLLSFGLILIGASHLKIPLSYKIIVLIILGTMLVILRNKYLPSLWSPAIWPILGAMFMFRLALYVHSINSGQKQTGIWFTLAYFFMLPNVAFPLFPVIDFETFKKTYFDSKDKLIYEQGQLWIVRGLIHLLLYRLVYYNVLNDPTDIIKLSDLIQYMLGTFLLYLRVSGQFHLIVGILHLFGFRLPETNNLYYFANSFTDLWRRINIYWKDFMMNTVFYPIYFKLKNLGPKRALIVSTSSVFFVTWILHSYQWFWLRGGFPILAQDLLFWAILGFFVVRGALKELKHVKTSSHQNNIWDYKRGLKTIFTFIVFCCLWSLWSTESVIQWIWILGAAVNVDSKGIILFLVTCFTIFILGGIDWSSSQTEKLILIKYFKKPTVRIFAPLFLLILLTQVDKYVKPPESIDRLLQSLYTFRLNAKDAAMKHRGYYEQLEVRRNLNVPDVENMSKEKANWQTPADVGIINYRTDHLVRDLKPSLEIIWNGNTFSTNSYGMRDQIYSKVKPPNTLRIAILGPSHVMGNGVSDNETFESIVEKRLNSELHNNKYKQFEILNFAVDGYTLPQQLALLDDRVFDFIPDIVIITQYHQGKTMTENYLSKIILNDITIPYKSLDSLIIKSGLKNIDAGSLPVPFQFLRDFAKWLGLNPRVPHGELSTRIRIIAEQINDLAIKKINEMTKEKNIKSVLLVLNDVTDEVYTDIPNKEAVYKTEMDVINLLNIFPVDKLNELRIAPWDDHPNVKGHQIIANNLYEKLIPIINTM